MTHRGYIGQVFEVRPALADMEDRGMPIDNDARLALDIEFGKVQEELGVEIARRAPAECLRVHPKKQGYKGVPPEVKAMDAMSPEHVLSARFQDTGDDPEFYHYEQRSFAVATVDADTGEPVSVPTIRWCRVYDFNPNSRPQVIAYIKAKGHPVPKSKEEDDAGEQKDTIAKKELQRLARKTGDTFYLKVIEYRELTKARGTYVAGFEPRGDGCVHTTFTFDTGIGQLSSRNPNIQNFPKTARLAKPMRRMVAAHNGKILTEWDFKSCHVLTLGFLAEDPDYIRLARLDMHSFVTGHILGLWDGPSILKETDEELLARFRYLKSNPKWKKIRDDQAKHTILGIGNGLKPKGMYERYMEEFGDQKTAAKFYDVVQKLFPKEFEHQERERREAHDKRQLKTVFGHIRRFYEVFRWDNKKGDWGHGDQSEEAVAFRLANIAFGHIREKLKELDASGLAERYGLFNNVHDSFLFHFPESDLEQHVAEVYPVLVSPSKILRHPTIAPHGLVIGVEGSWGHNWSEMHEIPLPSLQLEPILSA